MLLTAKCGTSSSPSGTETSTQLCNGCRATRDRKERLQTARRARQAKKAKIGSPLAMDLANARAAVARHVRELAAAHPHPAPTPDHDDLTRWESVSVSHLRTGKSSLTRDTLFTIEMQNFPQK